MTMGLFSFLTGKKDESPSASASASATAVAAAEAEGMPVPEAQTPFTAPEAWTPESLTHAKPETTHDTLEVGPLDPEQTAALQGKIVEVIKTVFDPEIPVDIYELGLIYDIIVDANRNVLVNMTLTSPACPSAQQIPGEVRFKVKSLPEVTDAKVEIVWDPAWTKDRMSEAAKLTLGFF